MSAIIPAFAELFAPHRYKVFHGGRGGAKSWAFARALIILAREYELRILCAREFQSSMSDSVHKLLSDQIYELGYDDDFEITATYIRGIHSNSQFMFKGLRKNIREIKSTEGVDICWVEEAQSVSDESWSILIPTIRKSEGGFDSEIWISFNPEGEDDPTYKRFVLNPPPKAFVKKVGWQDNPFFPDTLRDEMEYLKSVDYDAYLHVWEGNPRVLSHAVIFKGKYVVDNFVTPEDARFFHGIDFGFAADPLAAIRCYESEDGTELFIDQEVWGVGIELDEIPQALDAKIPTFRDWNSYGDNSRPETISHIKRRGFPKIQPCDKWAGSVEDGIEFLRRYRIIHIHERCVHMAEEAKLYSYKQDKDTQEVLPIILDKHNHCWDALRYALNPKIKKKPRNFLDM